MTAKDKHTARRKLREAVRNGQVVRPETCESCGMDAEVHGHHTDYAKPLEVEWLCPPCHIAQHIGDPRRTGRPAAPPQPADAIQRLADLERTYRESQSASDAAREARNAAVREALAAGWTHAQISEATGLTRGRIGQLAQRNR